MALTLEEQRKLLTDPVHAQDAADLAPRPELLPPGSEALKAVAAAQQTRAEKLKTGEVMSYWVEDKTRGGPETAVVAPGQKEPGQRPFYAREEGDKELRRGTGKTGGEGGHYTEDPRPGVTSDFQADSALIAGEHRPRPTSSSAGGGGGKSPAGDKGGKGGGGA